MTIVLLVCCVSLFFAFKSLVSIWNVAKWRHCDHVASLNNVVAAILAKPVRPYLVENKRKFRSVAILN